MSDALVGALYDASGEEPPVRLCKNGDGRPMDMERGPYGGLCFECRERERERRATGEGAEGAPKPVRAAETPGGGQTLGQLARALVKPAERAEKAVMLAKGAKGEERKALLALQEGLAALRDAAASLIRE